MNIKESLNRTVNLLGTAIVALSGFAFAPEMFVEDEMTHRLDEGLLLLWGVIAIIWYKWKGNSVTRSVMPIVFVVGGLLIKIMAFMIEMKDKEDVGDEMGAMVLFTLASIVMIWLFLKTKKLLTSAK